jgi:hypothetical protein
VYDGEFAKVVEGILRDMDSKGSKLAPTFTFVDPFGYAGFPLNLISQLLKPRASEVLITFMASRIRRFLDEFHEDVLDALFDSPDWRKARSLSGDKRVQFLLELYVRRLKEATPAKYVLTFEMVSRDGEPIYWLTFATKHPKGCEVMKEAMWAVDPKGAYRFYDAAAGVRRFVLEEDDPEWARQAREHLYSSFRGRRVAVEGLKEFIAPTSFLWRTRKLLVPLEKEGKIVEVSGRLKRLTYPPGSVITFA